MKRIRYLIDEIDLGVDRDGNPIIARMEEGELDAAVGPFLNFDGVKLAFCLDDAGKPFIQDGEGPHPFDERGLAIFESWGEDWIHDGECRHYRITIAYME